MSIKRSSCELLQFPGILNMHVTQGRKKKSGPDTCCVGAAGVLDAAWLLRIGENARQAATIRSAINGMSQRSERLNIGLPSFSISFN